MVELQSKFLEILRKINTDTDVLKETTTKFMKNFTEDNIFNFKKPIEDDEFENFAVDLKDFFAKDQINVLRKLIS